MATLQFKGKNIIWNHHMSVPYHTLDLDEKLSYKQEKADGNLIIEGDNLPALKSLLPQYSGRIKCIYIDPPYNTGKENWVYNDNVNSPLIRDWIGKEVGQDDLTRHDKWLCMMAPRLKVLRELLSKDGVIFISIDDSEVHHLRALLNDILGEDNFIENIIWQKKYSPQNDAKYFSDMHDFILCFAKNKITKENTTGWKINLLPRTSSQDDRYSNRDNDPRGNWKSSDMSVRTYNKNTDYPIETPSGRIVSPPKGRCWRVSKEKYEELVKDNRIWFGENGDNVPSVKKFLTEVKAGIVPVSIWFRENVGDNQEAKKEIMEIFADTKIDFETPKPTRLIKHILRLGTGKDDIVLDAFAGSGTTAQAVLELNEEDEGNRKFILIQMPENSEKEPKKNIARDITRERVVKVIEKKLKNKDIGFEYRRVGQPIDAETILSGQLPTYKQLAKYVYYLATGQSPKDKDIDEKKFLAGKVDHTEVYLLYTPDMEELKKMAITFEWAKEISKGNENKKIVYAPACFMDDEYLEQFNIKFVSIPYNLFEREK